MAKVKSASAPSPAQSMRPAMNPENEESQCISLAMTLVKQRLIDGTASSQETTHFLKLATRQAKLQEEILEKQKDLITAKTEQIHSSQRTEELMQEAINAMRNYSGNGDPDEYEC